MQAVLLNKTIRILMEEGRSKKAEGRRRGKK